MTGSEPAQPNLYTESKFLGRKALGLSFQMGKNCDMQWIRTKLDMIQKLAISLNPAYLVLQFSNRYPMGF